jgi:molybdenum cofactor cytidylyltransferase
MTLHVKPPLAIVLLAAGESSRLGQPKQLVKYGNESLLRRQSKMLLNTQADIYCILGHQSDVMTEELDGLDVSVYTNVSYKNGLGSSIRFAAKTLPERYEGMCFIQVDQWRLQTTDIETLIHAWQQFPKKIHICHDQNKNMGPPVIFPKSYFKELSELSGQNGAKNIVDNHIDNCNTIKLISAFDDLDTQQQLVAFTEMTQ